MGRAFVLPGHMTPQCVTGRTELATIRAGVPLRHNVLGLYMLEEDGLVLGAVRTGKAAPQGTTLHLLPHHLTLNQT